MHIYILEQCHYEKLDHFITNCKAIVLAQHTLEWRNALLGMNTDKAYYIVAEEANEIVAYLPLFKFYSNRGNLLQSSPYPASYGGIITDSDERYKPKIFEAIFEFIFSNKPLMENVILFTIVTSPFTDDIALYQNFFNYDYKKQNFFQYLDLENNDDKQKSKFRNNLRRNLRKAKANKFDIVFSENFEDTKKWYEIIQSRFLQKGIKPAPYDYYYSLTKNLFPAMKGLYIHLYKDATIVASSLFFYNSNVEVDIFLRAVKPEFVKTQAGTYLDYLSIQYFKDKSYKYFNWQSSPKMSSPSYEYKKAWGSNLDYHYYLTKKVNGFDNFFQLTKNELQNEYPNHYLMPFEEIQYAA